MGQRLQTGHTAVTGAAHRQTHSKLEQVALALSGGGLVCAHAGMMLLLESQYIIAQRAKGAKWLNRS